MTEQEGKTCVCEKCGKEVNVLKEGKNPGLPHCCGQEMNLKKK